MTELAMGALFWISIIMVCIVCVSARIGKKPSSNRPYIMPLPDKSPEEIERQIMSKTTEQTMPKPVIREPVVQSMVTEQYNIPKSTLAVRDTDDWLSKQLREERINKIKMSEMMGLKLEHESHCDADMLKREHERTHGFL